MAAPYFCIPNFETIFRITNNISFTKKKEETIYV